tara:strand:- start:2495 stop:3625 length:1131 start_codon:yes stop_codon:yes gene_type:complete
MNIAIFTTFDYSLKTWKEAGVLTRELEFFNYLSKKYNLNFTFVTYGDKNDIELIQNYSNFKVIPIYSLVKLRKNKPTRYLNSLIIPFKLKKYLKNIDLIYQNQLLGSWVSIITKYVIKKPLMIRTGYDMFSFAKFASNSSFKILLYKMLTLFSISLCDLFTVTSKTDYQIYEKNFKKFKDKVLIRPNWVISTKRNPLNNRNKNKILSVGRLVDQKNFELLIKEFQNTNDLLEIDIVGEGSQLGHLSELGKDNKVKLNFLGKLTNEKLNLIYQDYIYYFSTSKYEGNPKTVLEAMAAGCIVVLSNIPNHTELVEDGVNGFLFELKNPELLKLFKSATRDLELLEKISLNAKTEIDDSNSLNEIAHLFYEDFVSLNSG